MHPGVSSGSDNSVNSIYGRISAQGSVKTCERRIGQSDAFEEALEGDSGDLWSTFKRRRRAYEPDSACKPCYSSIKGRK